MRVVQTGTATNLWREYRSRGWYALIRSDRAIGEASQAGRRRFDPGRPLQPNPLESLLNPRYRNPDNARHIANSDQIQIESAALSPCAAGRSMRRG